jgi:hypothetical protein
VGREDIGLWMSGCRGRTQAGTADRRVRTLLSIACYRMQGTMPVAGPCHSLLLRTDGTRVERGGGISISDLISWGGGGGGGFNELFL